MLTQARVWIAASVLLALVIGTYLQATAQVLTPRPEELRFEALLIQPVATAGRRSVVAATSAMLVKDRVTEQCFVAVTIGNSMGLSPAPCER